MFSQEFQPDSKPKFNNKIKELRLSQFLHYLFPNGKNATLNISCHNLTAETYKHFPRLA